MCARDCVSGVLLVTSDPSRSVTAVGQEWQGTQSSSVASRDQARRGHWGPVPSRSPSSGDRNGWQNLHLTKTGGCGPEVT